MSTEHWTRAVGTTVLSNLDLIGLRGSTSLGWLWSKATPDTNSISSAAGMSTVSMKQYSYKNCTLDLNALIQTLVGRHEESGKFCCLTCGKLFEAKQSVERHAEIHLGLSHHCIVCDKVFNTRNTLATHYTKQHPNEVATPWAMKLK